MTLRLSHLPIAFLSLFVCTAAGQTAETRPKIGLVLSGGGARGAAHVGVLKALEELRVPVGCIAGTSIGAVVGGLYASGMSPDEIESWFNRANWRELFSDRTPRYPSPYRTKERDFDLNQNLEFNFSKEKSLKLPSGFIAGQNLIVILRELLLPVRDIRDFDKLRIPFRAIATDIETGERIVLRRGDLVSALRATMSVPTVFTPYKIEDRLLIDGGTSSNLPIDTAREMGADRIIAVDAHEPLKEQSELETITAVANQMIEILIQRETRAQIATLGAGDLHLYLSLEGASVTDFDRVAQNIEEGYRLTMNRASTLRTFAVSEAEYASFVARQRLARENALQITFFKIETAGGVERRELRRPIDFAPGEHLAFAQLAEPFAGVETLRHEEIVDFKVIDEGGRTGLLLTTQKKRKGPHYFTFGLDFAYSSSGETNANLLLSIRLTELNALGAEWRTFASVGDSTRVFTEFVQPIEPERRFFLAPGLIYGSEFIEGENADGDRHRFRLENAGATIDAGANIGHLGEVRFGFARGLARVGHALGLPDDLRGRTERADLHATLRIDMLDRPNLPTRGWYAAAGIRTAVESLGASDNYTRFEGQVYAPFTFGKNTLVPRVATGLRIGGNELPIYDRFSLGGFLQLSGFARRELYDQNMLLGELIYYRELLKLPAGTGRALYLGGSLEAGNVWSDVGNVRLDDFIVAGSVFLGADTILGPMYLGIGAAESGQTSIYFQLAPAFWSGRADRNAW